VSLTEILVFLAIFSLFLQLSVSLF